MRASTKNGIARRMCGNIRIASKPNNTPREAVLESRDNPYAAIVPIDTDVTTVPIEITAELIRKCQNPFSTQTCQWNSNVGVKMKRGGTANASTGCLMEVRNPQMSGVRLIAVN